MSVRALRPWAAFVVLPLALGVLAYLALRAPGIRLFSWAHALGLDAIIGVIRNMSAPLRDRLPSWVVGSGPDAAWAFAFGAAVGLVWRGRSSRAAWAWRAGCGLVAIFIEAGQGLGIVPGVFDALDLASMAIGYAIGCAITSRSRTCPADTSSRPRRACSPRAPT